MAPKKTPLLFLIAILLAGCGHTAGPAKYAPLSANGQPLRSAFNGSSNKVVLLLLVSPT